MPTGDLSLAIGYWIVSHKSTLQRWWAISLLATIFLSTFWVVTSLSVYLVQSARVSNRLVTMAEELHSFSPRILGTPAALTVGATTVIRRTADRVDLVAVVKNPNEQWGAAAVRYHFSLGQDQSSASATAFINPGQARPLMALNQTFSADSSLLVIEGVDWMRLTPSIPVPTFAVSDAAWEPTQVELNHAAVQTVAYHATIRNSSVYNYYHVIVPVVARAGDAIVAVDEQSLGTWLTRTDKPITVSWPYAVHGVTSIESTPIVDIFDQGNRF